MTHISPLPDPICPECGHPRTPSDSERIQFCQQCRLPHAIISGKYKIERKLAEGGCGVLYLAQHTQLKMEPMRVIKFLKPEYFNHASAGQRFAREVEITAALSQRNQHIVRVYDDFGDIEGLGHFYIMEYLRGEDLHQRSQRSPDGVPLDVILHIADQLLEAMHEAHEAQIIHRDLKPHNVFLLERGGDPHFVKVIDFGIAKGMAAYADTGITQGVIGTPEYMAPEQCTGQQTDQRTDIYAIGMILYELLVGHTPFLPPGARGISAMNMAIAQMMEAPRPPSEARPDREIPASLEAVVMKAIQKSPAARYPSAKALQEALAEANPYQGTTPELLGVSVPPDAPLPMYSGLPSSDELPSVDVQEAAYSKATPLPPTEQFDTTQRQPNYGTWAMIAGLVLLLAGGVAALLIMQAERKKKKLPTVRTSNANIVKQRPRQVPVAPRTRRASAPKTTKPPQRPTRPSPPVQARRRKPQRRWRRPRRVRRRLARARRPAAARRGPCPPAPKGQRWVVVHVSPPHASLKVKATLTASKDGGKCMLVTPGKRIILTVMSDGYTPCILPLLRRHPRMHLKLRREADQVGSANLAPSPDYCLK